LAIVGVADEVALSWRRIWELDLWGAIGEIVRQTLKEAKLIRIIAGILCVTVWYSRPCLWED
jgi:hypothetical protein